MRPRVVVSVTDNPALMKVNAFENAELVVISQTVHQSYRKYGYQPPGRRSQALAQAYPFPYQQGRYHFKAFCIFYDHHLPAATDYLTSAWVILKSLLKYFWFKAARVPSSVIAWSALLTGSNRVLPFGKIKPSSSARQGLVQ